MQHYVLLLSVVALPSSCTLVKSGLLTGYRSRSLEEEPPFTGERAEAAIAGRCARNKLVQWTPLLSASGRAGLRTRPQGQPTPGYKGGEVPNEGQSVRFKSHGYILQGYDIKLLRDLHVFT